MSDALASWNDGAARQAVVAFVERAVSDVPVEERVAVFDNDGTLWCEKPLPIQADFILRRLFEIAQADAQLRDRQPWKAAYERDYGWLGTVLAEHYAGDDTNVRTLLGGVLAAFAGITVDEFEAQSDTFLRTTEHPTLGWAYLKCAYAPMLELLAYLEVNGFSNYIASGGGRDFMRPISHEVYGIPRERAIGSATALSTCPTRTAARSSAGPTPTTLTMAHRSRSASGVASAADHCSPRATPTATSRCSISPGIRTSHSSRCSCSTTTPTASLTTPPVQSRRWTARTQTPGR
jgi:phosphoglycolate phosphatase-like HAD superfamily hydrolase